MKKKAGCFAGVLFVIIIFILSGCITAPLEKSETEVSFVSANEEPAEPAADEPGEAIKQKDEAADPSGSETGDRNTGNEEPSELGAAETEPPENAAPADAAASSPAEAESPVSEREPVTDIEPVNEPDVSDEPWLSYEADPRELIIRNLELPGIIEAVYDESVPVIVPCTDITADWSLYLYYWPENAGTAKGIRLTREHGRFIGAIKTDLLPGDSFYYLFRVEPSGESGDVFDFPGGPVPVANNGPESYSRKMIAESFFYQPLFDVEKPGDSPGARRGSRGWEVREFYLEESVKRWSCRILFRRKSSNASWTAYKVGGVFGAANGQSGERIPYNLPLRNLKPGDVVEYCFEVKIMDTNQTFILENENPPSFSVK